MDWQYGAAPLGFQPVESVDQASHVRGAVLVCTSERARDRVHHDQAWIDSASVEEDLVCDAPDCLNDLCRGESVMDRRHAIRQTNWIVFQLYPVVLGPLIEPPADLAASLAGGVEHSPRCHT